MKPLRLSSEIPGDTKPLNVIMNQWTNDNYNNWKQIYQKDIIKSSIIMNQLMLIKQITINDDNIAIIDHLNQMAKVEH